MLLNSIKIRVRYAETDQMGFVYYGNYAQYLEIGRVAALKDVGLSYKSLEDRGFFLPVSNLEIKYLKAALYDDEIEIITTVSQKPTNRIVFDYEVKREGELLITASTTLFFMNADHKPCRSPQFFSDRMEEVFS